MVIAVGFHLFPFRTEKLSPLAPMVLQCGRVGRRLLSMKSLRFRKISEAFLFFFPRIFFFSAGFILHCFSSSDFTDESEGNLAYRITHGFPRNLAAGQWLAPEMGSCCFCHADFADDADFFLLIILVPQISRIHTEFFGSFFFLISINHNIMVYNLRISERINKLLRNS